MDTTSDEQQSPAFEATSEKHATSALVTADSNATLSSLEIPGSPERDPFNPFPLAVSHAPSVSPLLDTSSASPLTSLPEELNAKGRSNSLSPVAPLFIHQQLQSTDAPLFPLSGSVSAPPSISLVEDQDDFASPSTTVNQEPIEFPQAAHDDPVDEPATTTTTTAVPPFADDSDDEMEYDDPPASPSPRLISRSSLPVVSDAPAASVSAPVDAFPESQPEWPLSEPQQNPNVPPTPSSPHLATTTAAVQPAKPEPRTASKQKFQAALQSTPNWGIESANDAPARYDPLIPRTQLTIQDYETTWLDPRFEGLGMQAKFHWEEYKSGLGIGSRPDVYNERRKAEKLGIPYVPQERVQRGGGGGGGFGDLADRFGGMRMGGGGGVGGGRFGTSNVPERDLRDGDWECPSCNNHNFAKRQECHRCSCARPAGDESGGRKGYNDMNRGRNQDSRDSGSGGRGDPNDYYNDDVRASSVVSRHRDSGHSRDSGAGGAERRYGADQSGYNNPATAMEFDDEDGEWGVDPSAAAALGQLNASASSHYQGNINSNAKNNNTEPQHQRTFSGGKQMYHVDDMKNIGQRQVPESFKDVPYVYVGPSPKPQPPNEYRSSNNASNKLSSQDPRNSGNSGMPDVSRSSQDPRNAVSNNSGMPDVPSLLTRRPIDPNAPRPEPVKNKDKPILPFLNETGVYTKREGPYVPPGKALFPSQVMTSNRRDQRGFGGGGREGGYGGYDGGDGGGGGGGGGGREGGYGGYDGGGGGGGGGGSGREGGYGGYDGGGGKATQSGGSGFGAGNQGYSSQGGIHPPAPETRPETRGFTYEDQGRDCDMDEWA